GFPVVAFNVGAVAERLRALDNPNLLPLELDARKINERLLQLGGQRNGRPYVQTSRSGDTDVTNIKRNGGTKAMNPADEGKQDEGLSASVQVLPFPPGLYLFSVKSAMPAVDRANAALRLPAIHVGLGPGVR